MLIGEYKHNIDSKKRLSIPSKIRKELGNKAVITRGIDKCLFVYPMKAWEKLVEKLSQMPISKSTSRRFARLILAGAQEVEIDKLGRILIPDYLKDYADLRKRVVVTGVFDRLEIWDEDVWGEYKQEAEQNSEEVAEQLGELGI